MFPPVQTLHFEIDYISVVATDEQLKCLVRLQFIPNGLMYSTPQKRCCVRSPDGNTQVITVILKLVVIRSCTKPP